MRTKSTEVTHIPVNELRVRVVLFMELHYGRTVSYATPTWGVGGDEGNESGHSRLRAVYGIYPFLDLFGAVNLKAQTSESANS
jgi:hypothetical protein